MLAKKREDKIKIWICGRTVSILCNELNCKNFYYSMPSLDILMLIADDMKITHVLKNCISGDKKKEILFSANILLNYLPLYTILTQNVEVENIDKK